MAQSATAITLAHYLATRYRPDVEFLDGQLKERPLVSPAHGRVQSLLAVWFGKHEDEWGVQSLIAARTQVSDRAVRLPDVTVLAAGPLPRKALVDPPLLAIEVLSDTDSYTDLKSRALDLERMGIENIWLLDPAGKTAERWAGGAWQPIPGTRISIAGSPVYLDLAWLWTKLGPQD
jgi:Uma2 family endonuclease